MVSRLYTHRKEAFDIVSENLCRDIRENLNIRNLQSLKIIYRYDVEGIEPETLKIASHTVFSEPQTDVCSSTLDTDKDDTVIAVEYLPGQYDVRADSCEQCIQLISGGERPRVRTATLYVLKGNLSDEEIKAVKDYIINPVEARETDNSKPETLNEEYPEPDDVDILNDVFEMSDNDACGIIKKYALAMDANDLIFFRDYFRNEEKRAPTITELRVIDTYWSDHCRHTTFGTELNGIDIEDPVIKDQFNSYKKIRKELGRDSRPVTLMDIATIGAKYLRKHGYLDALDESEEINACTVKFKAEIDGKEEDYLLLFKNETHNHPTEIEPFGGASTCLGGAIRDPLSGRSYIYQAMRVTGASDPTVPVSETIKGKLPQKKLTVTAANGYSSYGNQIGIATGGVYEIYHPGYVAKRMEIGAVIAAAPEKNVVRKKPQPGDCIILLGGKTGRDGCGGATGSSKSHNSDSILTCGAEVQKGNPAEERKLQRLMRNPEATVLIKRCNDFGAGGVSVAVGELADGLDINLSLVTKKYDGLDGTELAISESQERMAVVISPEDKNKFIKLAEDENLEAVQIATVTDTGRMKMNWRGKTIVDLSREFLSSNGAKRHTDVIVNKIDYNRLKKSFEISPEGDSFEEKMNSLLSSLNICSEKGLGERFDSTIGASTVIYPFGGKNQSTTQQYMSALIPSDSTDVKTASVMSYGFDPYICESSPFHGAYYAVLSSIAKTVASGADFRNSYLTFQEYFEKMQNPETWGKPFSALLGALKAQTDFKLSAIGGKDSMSGSFEDIHVPPTLVSFDVSLENSDNIISQEFKSPGNYIYVLMPEYNDNMLPDTASLSESYGKLTSLIHSGKVLSAYAVEYGGIAEAVAKMSFGNSVGAELYNSDTDIFKKYIGAIVFESKEQSEGFTLIGKTTDNNSVSYNNESVSVSRLFDSYSGTLSKVFPEKPYLNTDKIPAYTVNGRHSVLSPKHKTVLPKVIIPAFPGTNCEYDSAKAFKRAGGQPVISLVRNKDSVSLNDSINELADHIKESQILMIPGGFSGADEPDGSGKFITAVLRNDKIKEAVSILLEKNDGLILGICNGFQALVKSGLLPYGYIKDEMSEDDATLTFNPISRHRSMYVNTLITSVDSPWLSDMNIGDIHAVPISHGEGRFTAPPELINKLEKDGRIITRYVDESGKPTYDPKYNPNFSDNAIEGIISPDGRILGKMGHSERFGDNVCKNIPGNKKQDIFSCGIKYFKI